MDEYQIDFNIKWLFKKNIGRKTENSLTYKWFIYLNLKIIKYTIQFISHQINNSYSLLI